MGLGESLDIASMFELQFASMAGPANGNRIYLGNDLGQITPQFISKEIASQIQWEH